ncbi:MAG: DUF362 domain-containing protein [Kiritimatiellae bacterium]|nr:DUF362 domain-containing protein [Kiritimatiellia bacterium]
MKTRVALAKCSTYRPEEITAALEKLFVSLGGPQQFIPPGALVLIKPNLLTDRAPEKAVTTHPEIVRALIKTVRRCGGTPLVGDSPAGVMKMDSVLEKTGFRALCDEEKVKFVVFEKESCIAHDYQGVPLAIARTACDADLVINVPKLKTHAFTLFTNAAKNLFGLLPGFQKTMLHKTFPNPRQFGDCLAFLYGLVRPGLTVCDAVIGMEGDGPSAGTPLQLGFMAASTDGVALDTAFCKMLNINVKDVFYLDSLRRAGSGETDPENIDLIGDTRDLGRIPPIKLPASAKAARFIPRRLVRLAEPYLWVRPVFTENCTACGRCVRACPVGALALNQPDKTGRIDGTRPRLDRKKCIGCCCCHEVCPERAIKMMRSPLFALLSPQKSKK